ncbi:FYVE, RhoGEF and PH domain-containing protein 1 [Lamellibrachia satsuma]|nr:FYVE, RhoGEF and PH domain-containing protein 1 [Lamellibrachia satsuma]
MSVRTIRHAILWISYAADYVKHLPKDSPDKSDAEKALELVEDAALHFEHMMKRDSVIGQLLKIQRQLDSRFGIVSPSRELVKEGKIMKVSIKNGKPTERYAFLFNDLLLICSEQVLHVGKRYKVRDVVGIAESQMTESENKDAPNAFYIMTPEKVFELCTSNAEEKTDWQNAIWKQVGECTKNKLRTLRTVEAEVNRKSVGKRAPVLVRFCDASMCMVCACEYTTIRRKHHCKGCGIVVCAKCSAHTAKLAYDKSKPLRICDGCFIVLFDAADSKYSSVGVMAVGRQQSRTPGNAVHKGYLQFSGDGGRNWKKRWFVLNDNNSLYLFKAPQDLNPALTIRMDGTNTDQVELGPRKKRVLKLETERKVYLLHDQDEQVLEIWLEMIGSISTDDSTSPTSP